MESIIRMKQLQQITGLSRSTIYELIARGEFPDRIPLGPRTVGWVSSEVEDWIAGQIRKARAPVDKDDGGVADVAMETEATLP